MKINSYAEGGIDKIIYDSYFTGKKDGILIEVGAGQPEAISQSMAFHELGWRTISFDANPFFVEKQISAGKEAYQFAIGDHDEDDVSFFIWEKGPMSYSSLGMRYGDVPTREIKVNLRTLDWILENIISINSLDVLAVDVEGWELEVMKGITLSNWNPKIVILETIKPKEQKDANTYMSQEGYSFLQRSYVNNVYIKDKIENNSI